MRAGMGNKDSTNDGLLNTDICFFLLKSGRARTGPDPPAHSYSYLLTQNAFPLLGTL